MIVIAIAMGAGSVVSTWIQALRGRTAGVHRVDDGGGGHPPFATTATASRRWRRSEVDALGRIALYLFIVMALVTLRLWELAHLALPMIVMLLAQVAFCWLMCVTLAFWVMGRKYEGAVSAAGFCGFMLGTTANAVACMEELVEKYGPAPQAFLVVPIVGAFLIDFTNSLIITGFANWLK